MRSRIVFVLVAIALLASLVVVYAQSQQRLNPMIALYEKGLPVFGVTHPAIVAGGRSFRGGGGTNGAANTGDPAAPPPQPVLADAVRDTMDYKFSDFEYNSYSPTSAQRFKEYMGAIIAAGGSMSTHAYISKIPI